MYYNDITGFCCLGVDYTDVMCFVRASSNTEKVDFYIPLNTQMYGEKGFVLTERDQKKNVQGEKSFWRFRVQGQNGNLSVK